MEIHDETGIVLEDDKIEEALEGLRKLKDLERKDTKFILQGNEEEKVYLQLSLKRIPKLTHIKALRLSIKHPLVTDLKSICLFVRDRDRKKKQRDYEEDVVYWKELLAEKGLEVGEIIPYKQLKTEYKTYEARRNLSSGFDKFLVDAALTSKMPIALGQAFVRKRKMPNAIKMNEYCIKNQFEKAMRKTTMNITGHGLVCCCEVGYLGLTDEEIIDNVKTVVSDLDKKLPGGWKNIDTLLLKTTRSPSLPIYMAIHSNDAVILPKLNLEEKGIEDELSTLTRSKVKVYPSGRVELVREEPDDLLELEHTQLPFENHILALQEASKNKKGKKKLVTDQIVREVKKKEGKRKKLLQKLFKDKESRQLANFKEAKVIKEETIKNKEGKTKSERPKPLNPFTKEGEKLLKKNVRNMRVRELENMDASIVEPKSQARNKKNKLKRKMEKMLNSTPEKDEISEDIEDNEIEVKKSKKKGKKTVKETSLVAETKEKFDNKLGLMRKLNKMKQKLQGDDDLSPGMKLSKTAKRNLKNKASLSNIKKENDESTSPDEVSINSSPKSSKKWSKKTKKEMKKLEKPNEESSKSSLGAKKSLTSGLPRIGSLKKKSYKVNSKDFKTGSQKNGNPNDEPKLLSVKSEFKETPIKSPKKSPMEKGSAKRKNKNNRNVFAKMQKN